MLVPAVTIGSQQELPEVQIRKAFANYEKLLASSNG
jgi:hypothetical protein